MRYKYLFPEIYNSNFLIGIVMYEVGKTYQYVISVYLTGYYRNGGKKQAIWEGISEGWKFAEQINNKYS